MKDQLPDSSFDPIANLPIGQLEKVISGIRHSVEENGLWAAEMSRSALPA